MDIDKTNSDISDREFTILRLLIDQYIREGQPVGSRTLSRISGVGLSPATLRNVMGDLEHMGLLVSPHTSAGRIPTELGYRVFVDQMLEVTPLLDYDVAKIRTGFSTASSAKEAMQMASSFLSGFTQMAGIVSVHKKDAQVLRQIEFLPLPDKRALVILVLNDADVQNRIIHVDRDYSQQEFERAANFLNQHYAGKSLADIGAFIRNDLRDSRDEMTAKMKQMIEAAGSLFAESEQSSYDGDVVVDGQTNLMNCADLSDIERLKELFDAFNRKRDIFHLLDQCLSAEGVQIYIGKESGYSVFDECSLVTAPYQVQGEIVGVLGVVGPTRMAYDRVVPVVDITSKLISAALNS